MFKGKTHAALDLLANNGKGGVLCLDDPTNPCDTKSPSMREVLQSKHPPGQLATTDAAQLHYIVKVPQGPLAWMPMPGADCALLLSHSLPHSVSHLRMWLNASALHILIPQQSPLSWLAG